MWGFLDKKGQKIATNSEIETSAKITSNETKWSCFVNPWRTRLIWSIQVNQSDWEKPNLSEYKTRAIYWCWNNNDFFVPNLFSFYESQVKVCLLFMSSLKIRQIFIPKAVKHLHIWCACNKMNECIFKISRPQNYEWFVILAKNLVTNVKNNNTPRIV